jgi:hypothetical protein
MHPKGVKDDTLILVIKNLLFLCHLLCQFWFVPQNLPHHIQNPVQQSGKLFHKNLIHF